VFIILPSSSSMVTGPGPSEVAKRNQIGKQGAV
jgi:hypothetical protein